MRECGIISNCPLFPSPVDFLRSLLYNSLIFRYTPFFTAIMSSTQILSLKQQFYRAFYFCKKCSCMAFDQTPSLLPTVFHITKIIHILSVSMPWNLYRPPHLPPRERLGLAQPRIQFQAAAQHSGILFVILRNSFRVVARYYTASKKLMVHLRDDPPSGSTLLVAYGTGGVKLVGSFDSRR
jgi:hypothetical protein